MRALVIKDRFGVDNLRWIERDVPRPGARRALVQVGAVALNFRDIQVIAGVRSVELPLVPFSDAAGVVVETGADVTRVRVGDRVMPIFAPHWVSGPQPAADILPTLGGPLDGVCAEFVAASEEALVRVPDHLSDMEASTLPCAAVSAWNALFEIASLRPGETALVQGTGGVSLFALLFAKAGGARVIVLSSSDDKLDRARALGADETINYRATPDWGPAARALTQDGVDCVVEIGGEATLPQSIIALRNGGRLSYVGSVSGSAPQFDLGEISRKSLRIHGIRVGNRDSFERMLHAMSQLKIRPVVDSVFPAGDVVAALTRLKAGAPFGKICLDMADL